MPDEQARRDRRDSAARRPGAGHSPRPTRWPGYWAPLSGKVEPGETQEEALIREVYEEVGLHVSPLAKVWESETDDERFRLHWWTAEAEEGDVLMDPGEVSDARWVSAEEFVTMDPIFTGDREFFDRVLPGLS
ncbi:MAG TPA: NUDIX domain-containing protein [Jiangellales bacterium]|nr:NUDIX domain-containing protein [Jiangellales bacterium]